MSKLKSSKLFLHVGTEKTGSTSIQNALRENKRKLKKEGICDIGHPSNFKKIIIAESLNDDLVRKAVRDISARIKREKFFGRNNFIISEEQFSGNISKGYSNSFYVVETLKKITEPLDVEVFIIIYLRRQDKFVESAYTQHIKEGNSLEFNTFISNINTGWFNWECLISNYSTFFGKENLIVRRFSKDALPNKNSLVQGFGDIIDSNVLKNYENNAISNSGYSRDALEIAKMLNAHLDTREKKKLRSLLEAISHKTPFDKYNYFEYEERVKFINRYESSNMRIAQKFFNSSKLFCKPTNSTDRKIYNGISNKDLSIHLFKMVLEMERILQESNTGKRKKRLKKKLSVITSNFPSIKQKLKLILGKYY